jgi:hypothetical protein
LKSLPQESNSQFWPFLNTKQGNFSLKILKLTCALFMTACISVSHAAIIIHVTDGSGNLLGAENVLVEGTLYDVEFLDGTCIALFNGCDSSSDFIFDDEGAEAASKALLNLVFVGAFNISPEFINGCQLPGKCFLFTPYKGNGDEMDLFYAQYQPLIDAGQVTNLGYSAKLDSGIQGGDYVYAVWTEAIDVPAPGTVILLSLGIAGLFLSRHRKQY